MKKKITIAIIILLLFIGTGFGIKQYIDYKEHQKYLYETRDQEILISFNGETNKVVLKHDENPAVLINDSINDFESNLEKPKFTSLQEVEYNIELDNAILTPGGPILNEHYYTIEKPKINTENIKIEDLENSNIEFKIFIDGEEVERDFLPEDLRKYHTVVIDVYEHFNQKQTQTIPFEKEEKTSDQMYKDQTKVEVEGVNGSNLTEYTLTYKNGKLLEISINKEESTDPVKHVVIVGTKDRPQPVYRPSNRPSTGGGNTNTNTGGNSNNVATPAPNPNPWWEIRFTAYSGYEEDREKCAALSGTHKGNGWDSFNAKVRELENNATSNWCDWGWESFHE